MDSKFYSFNQNNSGGYYVEDGIVAELVVIEADSADDANNRASDIGLFSYSFCVCCGERFNRTYERNYKSESQAIDDHWKPLPSVVIHYKDGRIIKRESIRSRR